MNGENVLQFFAYLLPTIVTGMIAFYFFRLHTKNEDNRRRFLIQKEAQKNAMPIRLQAYERMALFLERISVNNLVVRVAPRTKNKSEYEALLIKQIENEFEHNLSQQIYISDECWNIIKTAKSATIRTIRSAGMTDSDNVDKFRENILNETMDKSSPSSAALAFIKKEVAELWS